MRAPETGAFSSEPTIRRIIAGIRATLPKSPRPGSGACRPFYVDADATANPGGLPIGGKTMLTFPNSHLSYAITWYILAAMVVAAGWYVTRNLNAPKQRSEND